MKYFAEKRTLTVIITFFVLDLYVNCLLLYFMKINRIYSSFNRKVVEVVLLKRKTVLITISFILIGVLSFGIFSFASSGYGLKESYDQKEKSLHQETNIELSSFWEGIEKNAETLRVQFAESINQFKLSSLRDSEKEIANFNKEKLFQLEEVKHMLQSSDSLKVYESDKKKEIEEVFQNDIEVYLKEVLSE